MSRLHQCVPCGVGVQRLFSPFRAFCNLKPKCRIQTGILLATGNLSRLCLLATGSSPRPE